jgi:hypothetical protein
MCRGCKYCISATQAKKIDNPTTYISDDIDLLAMNYCLYDHVYISKGYTGCKLPDEDKYD